MVKCHGLLKLIYVATSLLTFLITLCEEAVFPAQKLTDAMLSISAKLTTGSCRMQQKEVFHPYFYFIYTQPGQKLK